MFPEPTELLLIGCSIASIWTPKSKSSTLTPKTNSRTYWQRKFHTWWMARDEWNNLLCLFNISHFSSTNCLEVMSKRTQEDAGEERVTAKSKWMMNLVSRCSVRDPNVLASTASESQGKTRWESNTSQLVEWGATKNGETCDGRSFIKLLRMEYWREVVFSRVEIWWNVGSEKGETCEWTTSRFIHSAHRHVCHRPRWYGH